MSGHRKKKLCVFITRLIQGGAQKVVIDLLRGIGEDYETTLLIGKTPEAEPNLLGEVPAHVRLVRFDGVLRDISPFRDSVAVLKLWRFFTRERFDILHLHTSKAGVLGSVAGRMAGVKPIIYTPHGHIFNKTAAIPGVNASSSLTMGILFRVRTVAYRLCDAIVALSEEDLKEQMALGLAPAGKFTVIMNGIDVESFATVDQAAVTAAANRLALQRHFVIGSVGRLSKEKGHDILLKAFAVLRKTVPDVKLLLVGDGACHAELAALADQLGIADSVVFVGAVSDPRPLLKTMDVFALPSRYESQGLAAMEAMCAGIPVVASNVGGLPGIITDGSTGLLFPPGDHEALASKIQTLKTDASLRDFLRENALRKARKEFAVARMIAAYKHLYDGNQ